MADRFVEIEEIVGTGNLWRDGAVVDRIVHVVTVWQKMLDAGDHDGPAEVPGMLRIRGNGKSERTGGIDCDLVGVPVELELEDGRRWPCVFQNSDGDLMSRGGFRRL